MFICKNFLLGGDIKFFEQLKDFWFVYKGFDGEFFKGLALSHLLLSLNLSHSLLLPFPAHLPCFLPSSRTSFHSENLFCCRMKENWLLFKSFCFGLKGIKLQTASSNHQNKQDLKNQSSLDLEKAQILLALEIVQACLGKQKKALRLHCLYLTLLLKHSSH